MVKNVISRVVLTLVATVLAGAACQASWSPVGVGDTIKLSHGVYGAQGEFGIDVGPNYDGDEFFTFCIEKQESFVPNGKYTVANLGLSTSSETNPPTLTATVAWLFREFVKDRLNIGTPWVTLGSYASFFEDSNADADQLQQAIWYYAGDINSISASNKYVKLVNLNLSKIAALAATTVNDVAGSGGNIGGVQVMQLKYLNGAAAQDQLWIDPSSQLSSNPVPEPASIAFWGAAVCLGAVVRRKRNAA